jgi:hypothetical protein
MNTCELATHEYLTRVRHFLCLPELEVKRNEKGQGWHGKADFLALDFKNQSILLVEVTAKQRFDEHLVRNIKDRTPTLEWYVRNEIFNGKIPNDYRLAWLLIVPERNVAKFKERTAGVGYPCEVMPLESILQAAASQSAANDPEPS